MVFSGLFDEPQRKRQKYTVKDKQPYYTAQKGKCNGCKRNVPIDLMHLDHVRAFAKGGSEKPGNFQLLCGTCNGKKGTKTQAQFEKKLALEKGKGKAATSKTASTAKKATAAKKSTAKKPTKKPKDPFARVVRFLAGGKPSGFVEGQMGLSSICSSFLAANFALFKPFFSCTQFAHRCRMVGSSTSKGRIRLFLAGITSPL